ncbi:MAG: SH3 domain-containing protein [Burkholderiaceae bacterium]
MSATVFKLRTSVIAARVLACSLVFGCNLSLAQQKEADALPRLELQVMATTLSVYDRPTEDASVVASLTRGSLLNVLEQAGIWYRVQLSHQGDTGWVQRSVGEYEQMTVEVFPAKGDVRFAEKDVKGEALRADTEIRPVRPGVGPAVVTLPAVDSAQVPPPQANLPRESISVPDRWRLMSTLGFKFPWYDPYNQNALKGDLPVLKGLGPDWFFNLGVISDSLFEFRRLPIPVANQVSIQPGANDIYGAGKQSVFVQNVILNFALIKGNTTFKPPDYEFRFVPVINYNRAKLEEAGALRIDPSEGTRRTDNFVGVQELFGDVHLRNVSDRYDFDSLRIGIQPFTTDFRGFLFQDSPFGIRLFGNRSNNLFQYNLAWFRRLEKDTNSGLNSLEKSFRKDDVFVANLYRQDWPMVGFTSQVTAIHNRNRETETEFDTNGFLVRPAFFGDLRARKYKVTYLGYNGDGHFGPWNVTTSNYVAFGTDERHPLAGQRQDIRAGFHATELSRDFDWIRIRGNFLVASGDKDPYDDEANGFDAIFENPQFAGADTSFSIRQGLPLIGGGGIAISGRNGILPSLRSSKEQGQSNFVNPGLSLVGVGADFDVMPQLRVFANLSRLQFLNVSSLEALRNQAISSRDLGTDFSVAFHWRPFFTQNLIINGSAAVLKPGQALKELYGDDRSLYSVLLNAVFSF